MKIIYDYCYQVRAYGPSQGKCLIMLGDSETVEDIKNFLRVGELKEWYEMKYFTPNKIEIKDLVGIDLEYFSKVVKRDSIDITGKDFYILDTYQAYLD